MRPTAKPIALLLIVLVAAMAWPAPVEAGKKANWYSVVTLVNKTKFRIYYDYKWGDTKRSWRRSLAPGETYIHWWKFKRANQDWAPWFWVRKDGNKGWYKLGSFFSPDTKAANGKEYAFMAKKVDGTWKITLHPKLYTD